MSEGILEIFQYRARGMDMPIGVWLDDLIWCPSQCYKRVQDRDGNDYVLYLRWRHGDPWQGHIIEGAKNWDNWGHGWLEQDYFEQLNMHFVADDVDGAKEAIEQIWRKLYVSEGE